MSFMKRLAEKIEYVSQEMEAICLENEHHTGDDANGNAYVKVCSDCALAIELMESEFQKLGSEVGIDS